MSGKTAIRWLRQARTAGYVLKTYFLWVRDPEITLRRIRYRVAEGGHNIAEDVVRRRFSRTMQNFFAIYRPLMDGWKLYENDLPAPRLLAVEKGGRLAVRNREGLAQVLGEAGVEL